MVTKRQLKAVNIIILVLRLHSHGNKTPVKAVNIIILRLNNHGNTH